MGGEYSVLVDYQSLLSNLVPLARKIIPLATSHHVIHLCNQFGHVFAGLISLPRLKSINFYQNRLKLSFFAKKYNIWSARELRR